MPTPNTATFLERLLTFFQTAASISFDNSETDLDATTVQEAIVEIADGGGGPVAAVDVSYDQSATFLGANVQVALDLLGKDVQTISASALPGTLFLTAPVTTILLDASTSCNLIGSRAMTYKVVIVQDETGGWALDLGSIYTPGGTGYTATTDPGAVDVLDVTSTNGSNFITVLGQDYKTAP